MNTYTENNKSTIAAIVTGQGQAGVGIIRVSGSKAKQIGRKITGLRKLEARRAYFTKFKKATGALIDEGVFLYFAAPNSFTGQDIVEFQGHGGSIVLNILLEEILKNGARQAEPGEFSARAFFNGKIDLVQAEAIADLISAESQAGAQSAINSMQGVFSKKVNYLIDEFINLRVYVEAAIDFVDEDIDFLEEGEIFEKLKNIHKNLKDILRDAKRGKNLQEGFNIVLSGNPNVGKSSLLNALTGLNSAIVTNIEGTTRDIIKEVIFIKGVPIKIFDTAGLRETENLIEAEGIKRAKESLEKADQIFWLIADDNYKIDENLISLEKQIDLVKKSKLVFIRNKIDLEKTNETDKKVGVSRAKLQNTNLDIDLVRISAKNNLGIDKLLIFLEKTINKQSFGENIFSARTRHLNSLKIAGDFIKNNLKNWQSKNDLELFAEDLRMIQKELERITGKFSSNDLLTKIFSGFCIGK